MIYFRMEIAILIVAVCALGLSAATLFVMLIKKNDDKSIDRVLEQNTNFANSVAREINTTTEAVRTGLEAMRHTVSELREESSKRLGEIKETVDEKLNTTLEKRLNESFIVMNRRLETLHEGLGEMKTLATGVGDLKKVLSNIKTRGTWGEVQLGALLGQMLSPTQYVSNVITKPDSGERVEYAVIMPGKDGNTILLPIDAKFPIEDYMRIVEASEDGNAALIEESAKRLETRILMEAKKISEKYIQVPHTTDFAIMYLPIEGLYAEVLRRGNVANEIQHKHKVMVCGPTTLCALVNSLQMGFKTLAIEKRSSEVWAVLSVFKTEFSKFCDLLAKTQKKIAEAGNTIESATKKTKTIQNKLRSVQMLDQSKTSIVDELLIELSEADTDDISEPESDVG